MHINNGRHVKDAVMRFKLLLPGCLQELEAAMDADRTTANSRPIRS